MDLIFYIKGYTNVDWDDDPDDRKSTSDFALLLNGGTISWKSKKQTCTTLSTMKLEFLVCVSVLQEVVWSNRFFEHLSITKNSKGPMILYYDSQVIIAYIKDLKYHVSTKLIDNKYKFVRDRVESGEITLQYIHKREMIVDFF